MPELPRVVLPDGQEASILSDQVHDSFMKFPPALQRKTIRQLDAFIDEAHANGSLAQLIEVKWLDPEEGAQLQPGEVAKVREVLLTRTSWLLAQFLRHSSPSRISEAVTPLTYIVETYKRLHGQSQVDAITGLYLAVALSKHDGEEERSLRMFKEAFLNIKPGISPLNIIWARANVARLLRQLDRISEAEHEEKFTRQWIVKHWSRLKFEILKTDILDERNTGAHILDHPEIVALVPLSGDTRGDKDNASIAPGAMQKENETLQIYSNTTW